MCFPWAWAYPLVLKDCISACPEWGPLSCHPPPHQCSLPQSAAFQELVGDWRPRRVWTPLRGLGDGELSLTPELPTLLPQCFAPLSSYGGKKAVPLRWGAALDPHPRPRAVGSGNLPRDGTQGRTGLRRATLLLKSVFVVVALNPSRHAYREPSVSARFSGMKHPHGCVSLATTRLQNIVVFPNGNTNSPFPLPQPLATAIRLPVSVNVSVPGPQMRELIQHLSFCGGLISLSMMSSGFIHVAAWVRISFL